MRPRFHQRAEGSHVAQSVVVGDPSLRLKNGYAQDDAIHDKGRSQQKIEPGHYRIYRPPVNACPTVPCRILSDLGIVEGSDAAVTPVFLLNAASRFLKGEHP